MADTTSELGGDPQGNPESSQEVPNGTGPTYTVKVGGEEVTVTLEELQAGYMRQSDYTRKTTDLANQRKELENATAIWEAYQRDPITTHQVLGEHFGVRMPTPTPKRDEDQFWDDDGGNVLADDPRIVQLEREIATLRSSITEQYLDKDLAALKERYPDADLAEVRRHAQMNGFPTFESAYRDLTWHERDEAYRKVRERQEAEAAVIEEKRKVGVLSRGSGTAVGSLQAPDDTKGLSFKELLAREMEQAGYGLDSLVKWE